MEAQRQRELMAMAVPGQGPQEAEDDGEDDELEENEELLDQ